MPEKTPYSGPERRGGIANTELIAHKLDTLSTDVREIQSTMKEFVNSVNTALARIDLVSERQATDRNSIARVEGNVSKVADRVSKLEEQAPINRQASQWTLAAAWAACGIVVSIVLKKLGVL